MSALQPIEFDDGSLLDLDAVAADVDLPPWLATRAGEAVRLLVAIAAAVDAARTLDDHRRALDAARPVPRPAIAAENIPENMPATPTVPVFACPHCDQEFVDSTGLLGHISDAHRVDKPPRPRAAPVTCPGCGREFSRPQGLGRHRPFCSGEKREVRRCRECGCTDENCAGCIERTGEPCAWVDDDLCSACVPAGGEPPARASEPVAEPEPPARSGPAPAPRPRPRPAVSQTSVGVYLCLACAHPARRHEDGAGMCQVGDCGCSELAR